MSRTSPTETFSWRPPARTIAYTVVLTFATGAPPGDRPIATPWTTRDIGSVGAPTSQPTGGPGALQISPRPRGRLLGYSPGCSYSTARGGPAGATTRPRLRRV